MPDALSLANQRRRGLLTGSIAALLTGAVAVATAKATPFPVTGNDDTELLALCAQFHRLTGAMAACPRDDDDGFNAKLDKRWAVSDRIMLLSATTDTGRREKAAVALVGLEENYKPTEGKTIRTTLAALRDIAGTAVAAAAGAVCLPTPAASDDDAALLKLCTEVARLRTVADAIADEADSGPAEIGPESEDHERRYDEADTEWFGAVRDVADTPARTLAGVRTKAGVMLLLIEQLVFTGFGDTLDDVAAGDVGEDEDRMALSLARDVMALEIVA